MSDFDGLMYQRDVAPSEAMRAHEESSLAEAETERVKAAARAQADHDRKLIGAPENYVDQKPTRETLAAVLSEVLAAIPCDLLERFAVGRSDVPSLHEVFGESRILRGDELRRRILARLAR